MRWLISGLEEDAHASRPVARAWSSVRAACDAGTMLGKCGAFLAARIPSHAGGRGDGKRAPAPELDAGIALREAPAMLLRCGQRRSEPRRSGWATYGEGWPLVHRGRRTSRGRVRRITRGQRSYGDACSPPVSSRDKATDPRRAPFSRAIARCESPRSVRRLQLYGASHNGRDFGR